MEYTRYEKKIIQELAMLLSNQGQDVSEGFRFDLLEVTKNL